VESIFCVFNSVEKRQYQCLSVAWEATGAERDRAEIKINAGEEIFKKRNHSRKRRQKGNGIVI
jgi:hypothetical protein